MFPPSRFVADGVADEVAEDLGDALLPALEEHVRLDARLEGDVPLGNGGRERLQKLVRDLGGVHLIGRQIVAVDLVVVDDGCDEIGEALALREDGLRRALRRLPRERPRSEELGKPLMEVSGVFISCVMLAMKSFLDCCARTTSSFSSAICFICRSESSFMRFMSAASVSSSAQFARDALAPRRIHHELLDGGAG